MQSGTALSSHMGITLLRQHPYSTYKPGQNSLTRDYYGKETNFVANGALSLGNFKRYESVYQEKLNKVAPKDFQNHCKSDNETLVQNYEFMHKNGPKTADVLAIKSVSAWTSTYRDSNFKNLQKPFTQSTRPQWSEIKPAHTSDRMFKETEYHKSFGTYGYNPRDKLPTATTKLKNEESPHVYEFYAG